MAGVLAGLGRVAGDWRAASTIPAEVDAEPHVRKTDEAVINEVIRGELSSTALESELKDFARAVHIRRQVIETKERMSGNPASLKQVPYKDLDYSLVRCFFFFFFFSFPSLLFGRFMGRAARTLLATFPSPWVLLVPCW